jgi:Bacterial aa3 type cytochrome c oxidase subunit IV
MADHGQAEYATATGNDLPAHEEMYDRFVHLVFVGCCHIANIVIGLAIGALTGHWFVALGIFIVATFLAFRGLRSGARLPSGIMVVLSLIALGLTSGG